MLRKLKIRTPRGEALQEEAADWLVRSRSDRFTAEEEAGFESWKAEDPSHGEELARQEAIWDGVAGLSTDSEAREILWNSDIVRRRPGPGRKLAWGAGGLAVAASLALAFIPGAPVERLVSPAAVETISLAHYATAPGERRTIALADGSRVTLNTSSTLRVHLVSDERRLYLDEGQAFFEVAEDGRRPFRVFAGTDEVRAIGTAFEVQRLGSGARVVLASGKVAVYRYRSVPAPLLDEKLVEHLPEVAPTILMNPGQAAVIEDKERVQLARVDLAKAEAWRSGRLILDAEPLSAAVADINRYGGPQIRLADPELGDLRVSGVFHTASPDKFAESVSVALPVRIARRTETELVLASK